MDVSKLIQLLLRTESMFFALRLCYWLEGGDTTLPEDGLKMLSRFKGALNSEERKAVRNWLPETRRKVWDQIIPMSHVKAKKDEKPMYKSEADDEVLSA